VSRESLFEGEQRGVQSIRDVDEVLGGGIRVTGYSEGFAEGGECGRDDMLRGC